MAGACPLCVADGGRLVLRRGPAASVVPEVAAETGAEAVYWNRRYGAAEIEIDRRIKAELKENGIAAESFNGSLLHEPWQVLTQAKGPYKVFTPFHRAASALPVRDLIPARRGKWPAPAGKAPVSDKLEDG